MPRQAAIAEATPPTNPEDVLMSTTSEYQALAGSVPGEAATRLIFCEFIP